MSRKTLAITTAALGLALLAPAVPAAASTAGHDPAGRTQFSDGNDRDGRHHHRHHRWFAIGGVIEDIDVSKGEIRIDPRRGPDRIVEVREFTRINLNGDRASLSDLDVGDRAFVKGVKKHGDRWALKIWAAN